MTIVNLNKYRKQRQRSEDEHHAVENRIRFGLRKDERIHKLREHEQAAKDMEGKRLDQSVTQSD